MRGGSRNRSGPPPDPRSGRSDRRGLGFEKLPAHGHMGPIPDFPLPKMLRYRWEFEDKRRFQVLDEGATDRYRDRELEVWAEVWRTPQAAAWDTQTWRWSTIAEFCRLKTVVEGEPDANAALVAQLHRYRDQVGLTPAGLRENGWIIAYDEVAAQREERAAAEAAAQPEQEEPPLRLVGPGA